MTTRAEFKLPLMGKLFKIRRLPHQPADKKYALATGAFRQPGQKIGYLMELTGHRQGKILAWLQDGGSVYECTEPLAYLPQGEPSVLLSQWREGPGGRVDARVGTGDTLRLVSQYRGTSMFNFFEPSRDLGKLPKQALGMGEFLAACFLEFVEFPRLEGSASPVATASTGQMIDVLTPFREQSLPDACDMLVFRVDNDPTAASGFERYVAWTLKCANADRLRAIATRASVGSTLLSSTGLFWLHWDSSQLEEGDLDVLLGVESALNRCKVICDEATGRDGVGATAMFDEAYCSERDFASLRGVADGAPALLEQATQPNRWLELEGVSAQQNGEWDVRTRFASIAESLRLPYRLTYRFDCDMRTGTFAVDFTAPLTSLLPGWRWSNASASWNDVTAERPAMASCYALRTATLLAAAAFASSVGVTRVVVSASSAAPSSETLLSMAFDRIPFLANTLPAIAAGRAADVPAESNPLALLDVLAPAARSIRLDATGGLEPTEALPDAMMERPETLSDDLRPLPDALANLLHAKRVCDLDISEADRTAADRVAAIADTADESPVAAIAELETMLLGISLDPRDGRLPLYCDSFAERLLIDLRAPDETTRFYRMADASFLVLFHLSRLYLHVGDVERAKVTARKLCDIAPVCPMAAEQLASALAEGEEYAEATRVLKDALAFTSVQERSDYLYYRLAWMLWQNGETAAALAVYMLVIDANGSFSQQARSESAQLMEQMRLTELPSTEARDAALETAHVPASPTKEVRKHLASAAIGLTDAALVDAAWRATATLWWIRNDVKIPLIESLREGIAR